MANGFPRGSVTTTSSLQNQPKKRCQRCGIKVVLLYQGPDGGLRCTDCTPPNKRFIEVVPDDAVQA